MHRWSRCTQWKKSGDLQKAPGKALINERLVEGGSMLAGLWVCAYETPTNDTFLANKLKGKARGPKFGGATSQPAEEKPATTQPTSN